MPFLTVTIYHNVITNSMCKIRFKSEEKRKWAFERIMISRKKSKISFGNLKNDQIECTGIYIHVHVNDSCEICVLNIK